MVNDEYELIRTSGNAFELFPRKIFVYATQYIPAKLQTLLGMINTLLQNKLRKNQIQITLTQQLQIKSEHYWIIDVKHNKRFGPYNEKQFNEQKMRLKLRCLFKM